jgi:glycerol-3-phosphate O-acyltransferase
MMQLAHAKTSSSHPSQTIRMTNSMCQASNKEVVQDAVVEEAVVEEAVAEDDGAEEAAEEEADDLVEEAEEEIASKSTAAMVMLRIDIAPLKNMPS